MASESIKSGGVNIAGLLGIVFVVLKLTGYIAWSWWWVTAPFWGPIALVFAVALAILIVAFFVWLAGTIMGLFK